MSRRVLVSARDLGALALLGSLLTLPGCATVAPWERAILATPQMQSEPHPQHRASRDHVYRSREGATGGGGSGGGGCGCY